MAKTECSSIIIGKNVSKTGKIIAGHNEDNRGLLVMPQYYFPRQKHNKEEYIKFEKESASIPQVLETYGFYWSETRSPEGSSFADGFINENGVAVFSDGCYASKEENPDLKYGGIGYGLRRLVAERAKSARDGINIATSLLDEYGYNDSGRSYQIVDKDEAWVLQVVYGKNYVARRVKDDEVVFIPNRFTIHEIDFNDKENYIISKSLVSNAIKKGWYKPENEDYSNFDFAKAYQRDYQDFDPRQHVAQWIITGKEPEYDTLPFSVKPDRKLGLDDVKNILRSHYENTRFDASNNLNISPYRTNIRVIDASHTQFSNIFEFKENKDLTVNWKAIGRTSSSVYIPFILGGEYVPETMSFIPYQEGIDKKFENTDPKNFSYNQNLLWWKQIELQSLLEPKYKSFIKDLELKIEKLEEKFSDNLNNFIENQSDLISKDKDKFKLNSKEFIDEKVEAAEDMVSKEIKELEDINITLSEKVLTKDKNRRIEISITSDSINVKNIVASSVRFGIYYVNPYEYALAKDSKLEEDILKIYFEENDLLYGYHKDINNTYLMMLWGQTKEGKIFSGKTVIEIEV